MKRTFVIPALLFLAASAIAQTTCAQSKNPVSTALRDILPGRQKNTVAAVEAMPAEKFSYKPSADQRAMLSAPAYAALYLSLGLIASRAFNPRLATPAMSRAIRRYRVSAR